MGAAANWPVLSPGCRSPPCVASPTLRRKRWRRTLRRCPGPGRPRDARLWTPPCSPRRICGAARSRGRNPQGRRGECPGRELRFSGQLQDHGDRFRRSHPPALHCNGGDRLAAVAQLHGGTPPPPRPPEPPSLPPPPHPNPPPRGGPPRGRAPPLPPGGGPPPPP